ncbi:MAG: hypothetical protein AAGG38_12420 [Planctomycetota bacterium]
MLSVSLIERCLESGDYDRLLQGLSRNGLVLPLSLRLALGQSATAAAGLGLGRLVELTFGPSGLSQRLVEMLLDDQEAGRGGGGPAMAGADPLLTACGLAGLAAVAADYPGPVDERLRAGVAAGFAELGVLQDGDGLFTAATDRSAADRAVTTAFIVALLGRHRAFRASVRLYDTQRWFAARDGRLDRAGRELWDMARIVIDEVYEPGLALVA